MRVERDGARLRLDAEAFEALVAAVGDERGERTGAAGAVVALAGDPDVRARLLPVLRPDAQVTVSVAGRHGVVVHQVWLGGGAGTALAHVRDGMAEVLDLPPVLVPRTLARFVDLGPRPRLAEGRIGGDDGGGGDDPGSAEAQVAVDDAVVAGPTDGEDPHDGAGGSEAGTVGSAVADLAATDEATRDAAAQHLAEAAPEAWSAWAGHLRTGRWRAWQVTATWPEDDGVAGVELGVVDTPGGMVEVGADGRLVPTDPSTVWATLTRTVPAAATTPAAAPAAADPPGATSGPDPTPRPPEDR